MPVSLQELSPKPDFDATDTAQNRVPKLAVRGRDNPSPVASTTTPQIAPPTPTSVRPPCPEKDSKESIRSSDEGTLATPTSPASVAPWESEKEKPKYEPRTEKYEPRPATVQSNSFTTTTNERHSSDTVKQPFRQEVLPHILSSDG
jgi:hypothetical protein